MANKKLLEHRTRVKKVKPDFVVKESKFTSGVKKRWRYPRGKHSSVRQRHKGRVALPTPGYGAPKEVRGLDRSGIEPVLIKKKQDLEKVNSETQGVILSSRLGGKKTLEMLNLVQEKKLKVLNIKDVQEKIASMTAAFEERKKKKAKAVETKTKKELAKQKKAEEKAKKEQEEKSEQKAKKDTPEDSVEEKILEDEQKKIAEKTITKKQ
jgi:large subunit ribosomal protein L32e